MGVLHVSGTKKWYFVAESGRIGYGFEGYGLC